MACFILWTSNVTPSLGFDTSDPIRTFIYVEIGALASYPAAARGPLYKLLSHPAVIIIESDIVSGFYYRQTIRWMLQHVQKEGWRKLALRPCKIGEDDFNRCPKILTSCFRLGGYFLFARRSSRGGLALFL
jgi:hypothetical protein